MAMILTLEDLRMKYGFDIPAAKEALWQSFLDTAEEACFAYANIEQGEVVEFFDNPSSRVVLTHCPVLEVKSVKCQGTDITFRFEDRSKSVVMANKPTGEVEVTYTCGWYTDKVPAMFCAAIAFTVQHLSKLSQAKLLGITSRTTEGGTETIEQSTPPLAVQKMLEPYRVMKAL